MARAETIVAFGSQSREYHDAFQVFLDHTDQKLKARKVLSDLIDRLPSRRVFIDVGAGNGQVTSWFAERFVRTIAIETRDFSAAYAIAEFMLNLLPLPDPPQRRALEDYVRAHFARPDGSFRFSCDQDFIQIRKRD